MDIINFDDIVEEYVPKEKTKNKHWLAPQWPFRMIVNAPSGGGKTNMITNLVMNYLYFDRIYLFVPDLSEDKYVYMIGVFSALQEKMREQNDDTEQVIWYGDEPENIPDVNDLDPEYQNLIIVDDSILNKKANDKIGELFIRCRKRNASIIYQCQSWFSLPKPIRLQANYVVLFGVASSGEMREIAKQFAAGIDYKRFLKLFRECTDTPYSFMVIDSKTSKPPLKIRCKWDGLLVPEGSKVTSVTDEDGKELKESE